VFGGYTKAVWSSYAGYGSDSTAFIFSLRRYGTSYSEKYTIKYPQFAINNNRYYGPAFGDGIDIYVRDNSNIYTKSYANFGDSYNLPPGYTHGESNTQSYLAGSYSSWLTTEIEVFQIQI
jgi:hypothetical protein